MRHSDGDVAAALIRFVLPCLIALSALATERAVVGLFALLIPRARVLGPGGSAAPRLA